MGIIEAANDLPMARLRTKYMPQHLDFRHPSTGLCYCTRLESSASIAPTAFEGCFDLISHTSRESYQNSSVGWSASGKRKEMRLPDLRYLLVTRTASSSSADTEINVEAFLSFMLTYEDGCEVIYCYEIHLAPSLRRCGLGRRLMRAMEDIGRAAGVQKAMLTVFVANEAGMKFYEQLGWVLQMMHVFQTLIKGTPQIR